MPRYIWCWTILLFLILPWSLYAQRTGVIRTVVIDAGHGGHDPGAIGQRAKEKDINLAVALKLGNLIRNSHKDVRVIYTRDKDVFVELYRRAGIANAAKADLFISIHCNANKNRTLKGAETYVMGLHRSQANLNIAKFENAAILLESDYQSTYDGFDPNTDESYIIFSLNQNSNLDKSTDFAASIQNQMVERVGMNNRGVRQAGFLVLYKTTMPSVLVETGYISNPDEERFLMSAKGQDYIAMAIYRAFEALAVMEGVAEKPVKSEKKSDPPNQETNIRNNDTSPSKATTVASRTDKSTGKLSYRVQIATESKNIGTKIPRFSRFDHVRMYRHGGKFKYTVGDESDLDSALRLLSEVKNKGVKDAFIVIFRDEKRISQAEADKLSRN
ncbi:MAG: N-acetylmuramoyl-L-alanine amidase [Bacteroidales bacterium]|nr:N-acetylmuramoyl-L-alanine amidase [Bacteroidales bacterium]